MFDSTDPKPWYVAGWDEKAVLSTLRRIANRRSNRVWMLESGECARWIVCDAQLFGLKGGTLAVIRGRHKTRELDRIERAAAYARIGVKVFEDETV